MTTTVRATYENGVLKLPVPLPLPDKSQVTVTIQSADPADDSERAAWLKVSEHLLPQAWDNSEDDVFNELLEK